MDWQTGGVMPSKPASSDFESPTLNARPLASRKDQTSDSNLLFANPSVGRNHASLSACSPIKFSHWPDSLLSSGCRTHRRIEAPSASLDPDPHVALDRWFAEVVQRNTVQNTLLRFAFRTGLLRLNLSISLASSTLMQMLSTPLPCPSRSTIDRDEIVCTSRSVSCSNDRIPGNLPKSCSAAPVSKRDPSPEVRKLFVGDRFKMTFVSIVITNRP
jgi:hypothetical protein